MSAIPQTRPHQRPSIKLLEPQDVFASIASISETVTATILDPWYNRGVGGIVADYDDWLRNLVRATLNVSIHAYLWGFPDIVCRVLDDLPGGTELVA
jgi:hypothetical protein